MKFVTGRLERNWRQWKGGRQKGRRTLKTVEEKKEEINQENSGVREWTEEDKEEMGNMVNPYYELQENFLRQGNLKEGWCHDLAKQLSQYLYFFLFYFILFLDYCFSFYFIFLLVDT